MTATDKARARAARWARRRREREFKADHPVPLLGTDAMLGAQLARLRLEQRRNPVLAPHPIVRVWADHAPPLRNIRGNP